MENKYFTNTAKEYNEKLDSMLDTNELNRLQRAAKNKDKNEIKKWADAYEDVLSEKYYKLYKKEYMNWLNDTLLDLEIAICYVLHFNEQTRFGMKRINSFMDDLAEIIRGFYRQDFSREEYRTQLAEDGIEFEKENRKI